jgi:oxepin-CoA hydrolase/3-oxo-5,6-dehydrosuberyl-CoA semialdehyde dehydrogenase
VKLQSYAAGHWYEAPGGFTEVRSAVDGRVVASVSSAGLDAGEMVRYARTVGGPALRALTFTQRAGLLKDLAAYLDAGKQALYDLSFDTGATQRDHLIDVDGGIGTLFSYASKGKRELPDGHVILEGPFEALGRKGTFGGRHVLVPLQGVALFVNAYNFPCWGLLEKFAPAFLAGVPAIAKPATATAYVAYALVRAIVESRILPEGALQFIAGGAGNVLDELTGQDVLSFTGSLETSLALHAHPAIARNAVRFVAERDSLNAAVLGPEASPGTPEFELFVKEVVREMTVKAGQKCTAIRRALVPRAHYQAAALAIGEKLAGIVVGDPRLPAVRMGPLVSLAQRDDVRAKLAELRTETELLSGDPDHCVVEGGDEMAGAFMGPVLLGSERPLEVTRPHELEAFGPVCTLMAYDGVADAVEIVARGGGSLVASVFTYDAAIARELVFGLAAYHGRVLVVDRDCAGESTGHGSPMPPLIHGGPGRAGGGEELGGLRAVYHYMQRTALQGSPSRLAALTGSWTAGAGEIPSVAHPFRRSYDELELGETLRTAERTISLDDIEQFAHFTGDTFYAHMDEEAARANPFFGGRVAHGYLVLSFAAGLFVEPSPGPVLANFGLDNLRFVKPVKPGDAIRVRLTVKEKSPRKPEYGEVRWDVEVTNRSGEVVAAYDLLTLNARAAGAAPANGATERNALATAR